MRFINKILRTSISLSNERLYSKLALAAAFMFMIPLLLVLYLIFIVLFDNKSVPKLEYVYIVITAIIASGVFGYYLLRRTIKLLITIIKGTKAISNGRLDIKLKSSNDDELNDLAESFNKMTDSLESKIRELEQSQSLTRELFQKIGHAITSSEKIDALLGLVIQSTKKVLQATASFAAIYEGSARRLYLKAYTGSQDLKEGIYLPDDKGIIGFVISTKRPIVIKKIGPGPSEGARENNDPIHYKNILCVPVMAKDKVMGVIGVCDLKNTEKIDSDDLFLLESIAGQIATSLENSELNKDIEDTYYQTLVALARAVEAKDRYSGKHIERVSEYAEIMANKMGLDNATKKTLKGGAILHDLGKVGIRDDILNKEGKLTPDEYEIMKNHSIIGENILKPLRSMAKLGELVRHHHEHYDGTGYPDGLKGEAIPLTSRILTLIDIYDALTTERPYKKAMPNAEAIKTMKDYSGTILDPKLLEIFIEALGKKKR